MTNTGTGTRPQRALQYVLGGGLFVLSGVNLAVGSAWYLIFGLAVAGLMAIVGSRRIFRAGVDRTGDQIACRYVPWFEGNVYIVDVGLPVFAITLITASFFPGNPLWVRFVGIALLCLLPLFLDSARRLRQKSVLRISADTLVVPLSAPGFTPLELTRDEISSITPAMVPNPASGAKTLQVEICYRSADDSADDNADDSVATKPVLLGPQLTVEPANLLAALQAWHAADPADPQLLDRIERILRQGIEPHRTNSVGAG